VGKGVSEMFCRGCSCQLNGLTENRCPECAGVWELLRVLAPQLPSHILDSAGPPNGREGCNRIFGSGRAWACAACERSRKSTNLAELPTGSQVRSTECPPPIPNYLPFSYQQCRNRNKRSPRPVSAFLRSHRPGVRIQKSDKTTVTTPKIRFRIPSTSDLWWNSPPCASPFRSAHPMSEFQIHKLPCVPCLIDRSRSRPAG